MTAAAAAALLLLLLLLLLPLLVGSQHVFHPDDNGNMFYIIIRGGVTVHDALDARKASNWGLMSAAGVDASSPTRRIMPIKHSYTEVRLTPATPGPTRPNDELVTSS